MLRLSGQRERVVGINISERDCFETSTCGRRRNRERGSMKIKSSQFKNILGEKKTLNYVFCTSISQVKAESVFILATEISFLKDASNHEE